jgi:murein DD-endopeptidase MepM/ murein hydrolase activator NlpD
MSASTDPLSDANLTRVSFDLGPWSSPDDPDWQRAYDETLAGLALAGRPVYAALEPGLAPTPLGERLRAGDAAEAEGWLEGYVAHAAEVIARYADRVAAFEVLPQPETTVDRAPLVAAAWLARALTEIQRLLANEGGDAAAARLVPCLPAGPQGGAAYLEAVYAAGCANDGWAAAGAPGGVPIGGVSVRMTLDLEAPPSPKAAAGSLTELSEALERLEGPAGAGKPVFVSGFVLAEAPRDMWSDRSGDDSLAADTALAAALKAIADDPHARLAAEATADMGPGSMPEPGEASRDGGTGIPETLLTLFAPEPVELGPSRSGPGEAPVVDGFDYPCWKDREDPWRDYKIDALLCDPGYFTLFKGVWHPGEDWNGKGGGDTDLGDPIYAIAHGVVLHAKYIASSWGNVVLLRHTLPDGTPVWSQYAHLDAMHVTEGEVVMRGQQVGTLGKGAPSAKMKAHLHFELRVADLPAGNWFPMVRDKAKVLEHYRAGKDYIAANRPGQLPTANAVTVIVDEAGPGFQKANVPNWLPVGAGHGGGAWYTFGSRTGEANVGTWTAALPEPGSYQVAVFVPRVHATTENAVYTITHVGGQTTARVNQGRYHDQWVPLGVFTFGAGGTVRLSDLTGEAGGLKREVAYDAVRWLKVG